jgi:hypothetical protein
MRLPTVRCVAAAGLLAAIAPNLSAQMTINFDALNNRDTVSTQFPFVTFSSVAGWVNLVSTQTIYNGSKPNFICTGFFTSIICTQPTFLDFSVPVSGLSFNILGVDNIGNFGQARAYGTGGALLQTIDLVGNHQVYNPVFVDFGSLGGITRLEFHNTDGAGIGFDDFTFTPGNIAVTPEPSTFVLAAGGLGTLGLGMLRRRILKRHV